MNEEDLKEFLGKKIQIRLKSSWIYTCKIEKLNADSMHIIDKFNERHVFNLEEIVGVSEVHNGGG